LLATGPDKGILAVVSAGFFSRQLTCDHGTFYAAMAPQTRQMLATALTYTDPCAYLTTQGTCDGATAIRCTDKFEGDRRAARIDCADLGMVCRPGGNGVVGCFDENSPPETAGGRADGGVPPGDGGVRPPPASTPLPPTIEEIQAMIENLRKGALAEASPQPPPAN
jgi:hypothetical protein